MAAPGRTHWTRRVPVSADPRGDRRAVARLRDGSGDATARATSAGGVVLRQVDGSRGRPRSTAPRARRRDLVAAEGHPDGDETREETALREVTEETGLQVRIVAPVGDIATPSCAPAGASTRPSTTT